MIKIFLISSLFKLLDQKHELHEINIISIPVKSLQSLSLSPQFSSFFPLAIFSMVDKSNVHLVVESKSIIQLKGELSVFHPLEWNFKKAIVSLQINKHPPPPAVGVRFSRGIFSVVERLPFAENIEIAHICRGFELWLIHLLYMLVIFSPIYILPACAGV